MAGVEEGRNRGEAKSRKDEAQGEEEKYDTQEVGKEKGAKKEYWGRGP